MATNSDFSSGGKSSEPTQLCQSLAHAPLTQPPHHPHTHAYTTQPIQRRKRLHMCTTPTPPTGAGIPWGHSPSAAWLDGRAELEWQCLEKCRLVEMTEWGTVCGSGCSCAGAIPSCPISLGLPSPHTPAVQPDMPAVQPTSGIASSRMQTTGWGGPTASEGHDAAWLSIRWLSAALAAHDYSVCSHARACTRCIPARASFAPGIMPEYSQCFASFCWLMNGKHRLLERCRGAAGAFPCPLMQPPARTSPF